MSWDSNFIIVDTETGGLITKEGIPPVTEIGICVIGYDLSDKEEYTSLVRPYVDLSKYKREALEASNLSFEIINEGKSSAEVVKEVVKILKRAKTKKKPILIGHNIDDFDIPILDEFFKVHGEDLSSYVETKMSIDTMWWGRVGMTDLSNYKLGTCLEAKHIDLTQAHRAMNDTRATKELARIFIRNLRGESFRETLETRFRKVFKFQF